MTRVVLASLALVACGPPLRDEEAFEAEFAVRWCERQEECALGDFERHYSSIDDCRDEKEDDLHIPHWEDDCEVDRDGAGACLDYLRATDCEGWEGKEIEEECEDAYDC